MEERLNIAITNCLVSHTCEIRIHVIGQSTNDVKPKFQNMTDLHGQMSIYILEPYFLIEFAGLLCDKKNLTFVAHVINLY